MNRWQKLPSFTPIKGFARFLYVYTHWETISDDLKKRDERLQAVEDAGRQLLKLQHEIRETHEAELRKLIGRVADGLEQHIGNLEQHNRAVEELFDDFLDTMTMVAIMLHIDRDPRVRQMVLDRLSPKAREVLDVCARNLRKQLETKRVPSGHIHQQSRNCEGPGCTNPGGAFTSERDGQIYEFCSEACRAAFERPTG
jgi:hypothetical protein